jgi:hypothetical protein
MSDSSTPRYKLQKLPDRPPNEPGKLVRLCVLSKEWHVIDTHSVTLKHTHDTSHSNTLTLEIQRAHTHAALAKYMNALCRDYNLNGEPPGAFDRWIFTQLHLQAISADPLIPFAPHSEEPRFINELLDWGASPDDAKSISEQMAHFCHQQCLRLHSPEGNSHNKTMHEIQIIERDFASVTVKYSGHELKLNQLHLDKLSRLYRSASSLDDPVLFKELLFTLLKRYRTLGGDAYQAAVPPTVMNFLNSKIGVSHECFASPLNCHFDNFCSAFPDTDIPFGSKGSFFDFEPEEGSYEANPPFVEVVMHKMAEHIDYLLSRSNKPLSFTVVVPKWNDPASPMWQIMASSPFLVEMIDIDKNRHKFCKGYQHSSGGQFWTAQHTTTVFFLQNIEGKKKWPVTRDFIQELRRIWCGGSGFNGREGAQESRRSWSGSNGRDGASARHRGSDSKSWRSSVPPSGSVNGEEQRHGLNSNGKAKFQNQKRFKPATNEGVPK